MFKSNVWSQLIQIWKEIQSFISLQLVHGKYVNSYTSIKENSGIYDVIGSRNKIAEVIDVPGNERQRSQFWERFKSQAR